MKVWFILHYLSILHYWNLYILLNHLKVKVAQSCPTLYSPRTIQSMEFSRPEYWNGWPFPSLGDLPKPGIKSSSPALQADSLPSEPPQLKKTHIQKKLSRSSTGKESACNTGAQSSIPGLGSSFGEGNGNPLQYSCLENSMDRETWWTTVCGVAKSWTWLSD